jgi:nitrogen fixation protein NifQ
VAANAAQLRQQGPDGICQARYDYWMAHAYGRRNDDLLAKMMASREAGIGMLPKRLGLVREAFHALLATHFPGAEPIRTSAGSVDEDDERLTEREDLVALMSGHRAGFVPSELWLADIVAVACMGADHLWQDLGLWSRADLGRLMHANFPALAQRNVKDMKWKRFLYKQLCQADDVYVCRAPSCEACIDYAECFGPEE